MKLLGTHDVAAQEDAQRAMSAHPHGRSLIYSRILSTSFSTTSYFLRYSIWETGMKFVGALLQYGVPSGWTPLPQNCAVSATGSRAYRELFEKSGEKPRAELFDEELLRALKAMPPDRSNDDQAIVQWVVASTA
jgi:hypothetical protein